jgi:hypothetical protein
VGRLILTRIAAIITRTQIIHTIKMAAITRARNMVGIIKMNTIMTSTTTRVHLLLASNPTKARGVMLPKANVVAIPRKTPKHSAILPCGRIWLVLPTWTIMVVVMSATIATMRAKWAAVDTDLHHRKSHMAATDPQVHLPPIMGWITIMFSLPANAPESLTQPGLLRLKYHYQRKR